MKSLDYYWQKYPAKICSALCISGDVACILSGAVGGNIFRVLAPAVGISSHLINLVFGKGGKTGAEYFVIEANIPSPFIRALRPWRYPVDTQGAMLVLAGIFLAGSGLNVFNVQGFINFPEALSGLTCITAASIQWLMKEKESHLQDFGFGDFLKSASALEYLRERLGPTRMAAAIFLTGSACQILGALYAMFRHGGISQTKDMLMLASGLLWFYGNSHLSRVKKARAELIV